MRKNKRQHIGIIGHFAFGKHFSDGQTVKTKILYDSLKNSYDSNSELSAKFYCVDTYDNKVNKIRLLIKSIFCIFRNKTIIILLSGNGMKIYFPLMYVAKKLFRRNIYHDVIGGNLAEYVKKFPKYRTYLNAFDENWVEFEGLKESLKQVGVSNCRVIPNFKSLNLDAAVLTTSEKNAFSFCMFSRVMAEKGVTEAILAIDKFNHTNQEKATLEIWGPIDDNYKEIFEELLIRYASCVTYKGIANYDRSTEILTNHFALLFPTHWNGEGFPGTIIDAYASALPVIASDWNANRELIDNFSTGIVYPTNNIDNLYDAIVWAVKHPTEMAQMRYNSIEKAKVYMPDRWIPQIIEIINK